MASPDRFGQVDAAEVVGEGTVRLDADLLEEGVDLAEVLPDVRADGGAGVAGRSARVRTIGA